jgi:hypothetical protein
VQPGPILRRALRLPVRLYDLGAAVEVQIAGLRFQPRVRSPEREEAVDVIAGYERRNRVAGPILRAVLSRLAGFRYDGSAEARNRLIEALPLMAFSPRDGGCR